MTAVPRTETAAANGFNALMRSLGTSSSSAVMGAVLASFTATIFVRPASGETAAPLNLSPVPSLDAFHLALAIACRRGSLYLDGLRAGSPPGIARTVRSVWRTVWDRQRHSSSTAFANHLLETGIGKTVEFIA